MVPEPTNPTQSMEREVRDMVNAITSRVSDLQKPAGASSHHHHHQHRQEVEEDENGIRIITLAGTNTGATMRTELEDIDHKPNNDNEKVSPGSESDGTYVNSNFQAVNNSIMLGSNYNTNDPGVHLDISELFPQKPGKKGKIKNKDKKDKEPFKSDPNSA